MLTCNLHTPERGSCDDDTLLLVSDPKGRWLFNDNGADHNPQLVIPDPALGCCRTNAKQSLFGQVRRMSGGAERPPLGQSGGAGLLVGVSAGEAPLRVEDAMGSWRAITAGAE